MGATFFYETGRGFSMKEAYSYLVEDAISEHGHDRYNGTISTTGGFIDKTAQYKEHVKKGGNLDSFMRLAEEGSSKFSGCWGIELSPAVENNLKIKTQVEHVVVPGTKRWELIYQVMDSSGTVIAGAATKGEAVDLARSFTEKSKTPTQVIMTKALVSCSPLVAKITYKKDPKMKPGTYAFMGWASC